MRKGVSFIPQVPLDKNRSEGLQHNDKHCRHIIE